MKNFPKPIDTMAGIQEFWFVPVDDLTAMGDIILGIMQSILFVSGKDWYTGYGVYNTKQFDENKKEPKQGIRFDRSFKLFFPGYSLELIQQLKEMKLNRFVIGYKDNNDQYKIAGTIDNPINFKYKIVVGKSGADPQGIEMTFYSESIMRVCSIAKEAFDPQPDYYFDFTLNANYPYLFTGTYPYLPFIPNGWSCFYTLLPFGYPTLGTIYKDPNEGVGLTLNDTSWGWL